jgi:hypothetical protein
VGSTVSAPEKTGLMGILLKWMIWGIFQKKNEQPGGKVAKSYGRKERFIDLCPIV